MLRLNILPEGYIYPKEERPVRDLLRRRLLFVKHRTAHILSLQSMITRNLGTQMSGNAIKRLEQRDAEILFNHPHLVLAAQNNIAVIHFLKQRITGIEREVKSVIKLPRPIHLLTECPGDWRYPGIDHHAGGGRYSSLSHGRRLLLVLPVCES